jgi:fumarylacetoacetase
LKFRVPQTAKTWVFVPEDSHFPIFNLPFGVIIRDEETAVVVRIGDSFLDLRACAAEGLIQEDEDLFLDLESLISEGGPEALVLAREQAYGILVETNPALRDNKNLQRKVLLDAAAYEQIIPMHIGAFVDFYSGINHASNVGKMFRPEMDPLLPNYRWLPVGYNGRGSSVIVSGEAVIRPNGQTKAPNDDAPDFGPTKELDFELELGFFTGKENDIGEPIPIDEVDDYVLGFVLVNDWSARDIQRWEYQPLGPFLAKSFATSISPWLVTLDALEPFRIKGQRQEPPPLTHLATDKPSHLNIVMEVSIQTERMKKPQVICRTNSNELYWNYAQQLAHQTSNGTPVEYGDLYASGTISGTEPGTFGSLLELTWRGKNSIIMEETGETRTFLQDGDTVVMTAYCQGNGYKVGFGEVRGTVEPGP